MKVLGWALVYTTDGGLRVYHSDEWAWSDLPADGVLDGVLLKEGDDGRRCRQTLGGSDYYWRAPHPSGEYIYGHSNDPPAEIAARYPGAVILRGKWTTDREMAEAARITLAVPWLP